MKQGQWKVITILVTFIIAIIFSTSIFVFAETPAEKKKKDQEQQQKLQQEQLKKQQEQQKQQQQKLQQEQLKKQQEQQKQQQQKLQQEQLKKQQEQQKQHPPGPTPGGPGPGGKPQTGEPSVQKQPSQPGMKPGQTGVSGGQQSGQHLQRPIGQPAAGPAQGQPGAKTGAPGQGQNQTNINAKPRTAINIKQPPRERQRVLTEHNKEIRPEHNTRAAVHFQSERLRFKPVNRVIVRHSPVIQRRVFEKHHFHPETYYARRTVFYETYRFRTPVWAFTLQPRFGLWDTPALAFILAHAADEQYALWYYNHRVDPDVIAWRLEMNRLAAANAELAEQLAVMDAKTQELQARGVQVDNSYVPAEMDDIALAAEVAVPMQTQDNQVPTTPQSDNDTVQQRLDQLQQEINNLKQQQNQEP